ncbi:MAG: ABC transporter substrate-binding protein [Lachnospiraceae bacterium]
MVKKTITMLLACTMTMLAGCGSANQNADLSKDTSASAETAVETADSTETEEAAPVAGEVRELTLLIDATNAKNAGYAAIAALAEEKLGIKVTMETTPGGSEGDNIVKTRLASGDMADLCVYNSGALLEVLNPSEYFTDITNEDFASRIDDSYKRAVSADGVVYGIPFSSSRAEGIMYNKSMYEKYGLEVPKTWDEFISNCDVLKEAGETAILGAFADSWTTQICFLGDAYNLVTNNPDFAASFDAGEAKWATTPEALRSFEKLADTSKYYNEDYLATTNSDSAEIMAGGGAAHYFSLSNTLSTIYNLTGTTDEVDNLGYFPVPSDDASVNGMTMWYPVAIYGNKNSEKQDLIKEFMSFYISDEALNAYVEASYPDGPFCVKDYEMPDKAYSAVVNDIMPYFNDGKISPALEYISRVKGADCAAICQELGSGQTTALEAAEKYDKDCEKQATQLGLNW